MVVYFLFLLFPASLKKVFSHCPTFNFDKFVYSCALNMINIRRYSIFYYILTYKYIGSHSLWNFRIYQTVMVIMVWRFLSQLVTCCLYTELFRPLVAIKSLHVARRKAGRFRVAARRSNSR